MFKPKTTIKTMPSMEKKTPPPMMSEEGDTEEMPMENTEEGDVTSRMQSIAESLSPEEAKALMGILAKMQLDAQAPQEKPQWM